MREREKRCSLVNRILTLSQKRSILRFLLHRIPVLISNPAHNRLWRIIINSPSIYSRRLFRIRQTQALGGFGRLDPK